MPLDVGRVTHLLEQMHRSEDDAGAPIPVDKVLVTDGARGFTWEDYAAGSSNLPVFLPETYGAVGDGTTDDTTAIQDTIDAVDAAGGGIILFSAKTYKITATLDFAGSRYMVVGVGTEYGPSIISMATANTTALSFSNPAYSGNRTETSLVRCLLVQGPGGASSGRGIYAESDVHLENVGIAGFYDGVYWDTDSYYSRAFGCFVTDCDHRGFVLNSTNNITLDTCRITGLFPGGTAPIGALQSGIEVISSASDGYSTRIVNCSIEYFTDYGIIINGGGGIVLSGNWFESSQASSGDAYIYLGGTTQVNGVVIEGNHFEGPGVSGFQGVKLDRANDISLIGNDNTTGFGALTVIVSSTANTTKVALLNNSFLSGTITLPAGSVQIEPGTTTTPSSVSTNAVGSGPNLAFADHTHAPGGTAGGDLSGTYPNPSVVDDSHSHSASTAPGSAGGELLISDTPSTPLVFADIVQNEAQDDFLYSG